jgi:hypothetical protein
LNAGGNGTDNLKRPSDADAKGLRVFSLINPFPLQYRLKEKDTATFSIAIFTLLSAIDAKK